MGKFPFGYGRGWDEEKAVGLWPRFKQRMREPATTKDYFVMSALIVLGTLIAFIVIPLLN